jgi:hypothetical protein
MNVVEPASYQRGSQLLPGSKERKEIEVPSLEELKRELNEANSRADRKSKLINRGLVIGSVITCVGLLLGATSKDGTTKVDGKKASSFKRVLKIFGYGLSIAAFIKGASQLSNTITVVEPDGEISQGSDKTYSQISDSKLSWGDRLRRKVVKSVFGVLVSKDIVDKKTLKNRAMSLRFRSPIGANKFLINEIIENGRKL